MTIRLTSPGRIALTFSFVMLFTGYTSGANLLFFLAAVLFCYVVLPSLVSAFLLRRIRVAVRTPPGVLRKSAFVMTVSLTNPSLFDSPPTAGAARFSDPADDLSLALLPQRPRSSRQTHLTHTLRTRGVYREAAVTLQTTYPLNMVLLKRTFRVPLDIKVFPAICPVRLVRPPVPERGRMSSIDAYRSPAKGFGGLFYGVRDYSQGDSLRLIHWPKTAHKDQLMVKEYEDAGSASFSVLHIENRKGSCSCGKDVFERSIDNAASVARFLADQKHPFMLMTSSGRVRPYQEGMAPQENLLQAMDFLTEVPEEDTAPAGQPTFDPSRLSGMSIVNYFFVCGDLSSRPEIPTRPFRNGRCVLVTASPGGGPSGLTAFPGSVLLGEIGSAP